MKKTFASALIVLLAAACASNEKVPTVTTQDSAVREALRTTEVTTAAAPKNSTPAVSPDSSRERRGASDTIAKIRDEGLNRSKAMETLSYLTDVIGPRLTGSPGMRRANEWTREKLESWGMTNAQLEAWGPFGRGWSLQKFSLDVIEPQYFPVKAYPNAWSPGFSKPLKAEVVFLDATNTTQLEKYKGKLKGAIVLMNPPRAVPQRFDPLTRRHEATNLLAMANADLPRTSGFDAQRTRQLASSPSDPNQFGDRTAAVTNTPPSTNAQPRRAFGSARFLSFVQKEGAALVLTPSTTGDAGTIFVAGASVPQPDATNNATEGVGLSTRLQPFMTNAPAYPAQATVAVEDYNRLVRMARLGEKLKMEADLRAQFHDEDLMAYNTIAEIPGTDFKDEIVMVGGHLDSWHSGTGATDNGTGVVAAMEALRIIKAAGLKPRRTVRVALWSGEEQGLLGSRAYVGKHFGKFTTNTVQVASAGDPDDSTTRTNGARTRRELVKEKDYEKLSVYFNLDNGAGKIRGVYMQGNEAVRPYFRKWLEPFRDLGAETLTPNNTGGTDHLSFHNVGLPGFQFIQDPLDYSTRTHHSNEDVFDRVPPEDLKQAATIMAAFVYQAAMLDEKLPRKPLETGN